jgi:hypothetical protein
MLQCLQCASTASYGWLQGAPCRLYTTPWSAVVPQYCTVLQPLQPACDMRLLHATMACWCSITSAENHRPEATDTINTNHAPNTAALVAVSSTRSEAASR